MNKKKMVVAYSGGLDTSVMVKWLSKKYEAEIGRLDPIENR